MSSAAVFRTFREFLKRFAVFFASMVPFIGNRGSVVMAAAMKLKWQVAFLHSALGSFLPIPFIIDKAESGMKKLMNYRPFARLLNRVNTFADKHRDQLTRHGYIVLFLVVSIPFTGIGCWAAALLADMFGLDKRKSCVALFFGLCISTFFYICAVYGLLAGIRALLF